MRALRFDRRQTNQLGLDAAALHDDDYAFQKTHLANKVGGGMQFALRIDITYRIGLHGYLRLNRGLEKIGVKRQDRTL